MKHRDAQITALLILVMASASSEMHCPPEGIKPVSFAPEQLLGDFRVTHCLGSLLCRGQACADYSVWKNSKNEQEYHVYGTALNISARKWMESTGTLTMTGTGQYTICELAGLPCGKYYCLSLKPHWLIEYGCVPDTNGVVHAGSWIDIRNKAKFDARDLTEIKEDLKKNGLNLDDYMTIDNDGCQELDHMRFSRLAQIKEEL